MNKWVKICYYISLTTQVQLMKKILIIGRHHDTLNTVLNMAHSAGYVEFGTLHDDEALRLFEKIKPEAVVIGSSVDQVAKNILKDKFSEMKPCPPVITGYTTTFLEELRNILPV
jgi:hypothetical protein